MEDDKKKNKGKKKNKKGKRIFKIILLSLLGLFILAGVAGLGVVLAIVKTAPPLDVNAILTLNEPSTIYDNKDIYIDDVNTIEKRDIISIKDVPKHLSSAFVSIEDERFEKHKGIDFKRIAGVIYIDVKKILKGDHVLQGASTITQQLVRNTMLTNITTESNFIESATRKIREMYLAMELEKHLHKEQILEAYMNTIPFGGTVHGIQAASTYYFNKPVKDLTIAQSAYLAGVPQAPGIYNAHLDSAKKDPSKYLSRTKLVLNAMYKNSNITSEQYDNAVKELSRETLAFVKSDTTNNSRLNYEWFSLPAIEQVKKDLQAQYKYSQAEINNLLMYGGLKIYTTMDKTLQDTAQNIINDDKNYGIAGKADANGIIQPQASAVIMDYHTGEVKVIIGGKGTQPARSYNRAAFNGSKPFPKPVGSSIKPITVYASSIDSKQATAATVVEDSPVGEDIKRQWPGWDPRNYETSSFSGYVTLREAITSSINLVAIKQEYNIGLKTGAAYAQKFGLTLDTKHDMTSLSAMALGELYDGENTLSMAAAYGTFGNNGMYTEPRLYRKVVDRRGVTILESKIINKKVLSPQSSYVMYDLLEGPVNYGTATRAKLGSMSAAGKTGTTGDNKEVWFSGLTPYLSGSIWIGNDKPATLPKAIGSFTSATIWGKIMTEAHKGLPVKSDIERPSGIVDIPICKDSGKLPTDLCSRDPRGSQVYTELFIEGTQPTTFCDVHVEASINKLNGKLANENTPKEALEKKIFIKRDYTPSVTLDDSWMVLPTEMDDTKPVIKPQLPGEKVDEKNNSTNEKNTTDSKNNTDKKNENKSNDKVTEDDLDIVPTN
jgi:penicillin-binding protein 1A